MNVLKVSKQNTQNQFSCDVQSTPPISANGVNPLRAVGLDLLKSWTGWKYKLPTSPGLDFKIVLDWWEVYTSNQSRTFLSILVLDW